MGKAISVQDDPASPLLFVLVTEYLTRILKALGMLPDFKFHPMCEDFQLTHLIFVDDVFRKGRFTT